ncbi:tyrosine-type recombinase/integrase [Actinomadura nitritigenes]|uniref:tyrosine-type recombinase/integrase n=1 Tax=Actinomadura nitritigenes TaxID=134602 RepID=UPI003D8CFA50
MNSSYDVRILKLQYRAGRPRPYGVRWKVAGKPFSKWFGTDGLADSERSELIQAARRGEGFDTKTGLPLSKLRSLRNISWFQHATEYIDKKWPAASANHRISIVETLVTVTTALAAGKRGEPDAETLRAALRRWAFNPKQRPLSRPPDIEAALAWVAKASPSISTLADPEVLRGVLDACATNLDGTPSAPAYLSRRRRVLSNVLKYAVVQKRLAANPLNDPDLHWDPPVRDSVVDEVDPRVVGSPAQMREMLTAVSYVGRTQGPRFVAFFGCMYYGMLRPAEATSLCQKDCHLPSSGWGKLILAHSKPAAGKAWTDSGQVHEDRGLKGRGRREVRVVPIPPELVVLLREHIRRFGVAPDGRLFRSVNGGIIHPSTYWRVWQRARAIGLTPDEQKSPVLGRPYDLRHGGVSWRLYAGVPAPQVAEWAGHSLEVLQKIYAKVVAGFDDVWFQRMDDVLDGHPSSTDEGKNQ